MTTGNKSSLTGWGIVALVSGSAFGAYAGINLLIPAVGGALVLYIGRKWLPPREPAYLAAIAVVVGHTLWMYAGLLVAESWGLEVIDVVLFAACAGWLWARPGSGPVFVLAGLESLALAINLHTLAGEPFGTTQHKGLATHIGLRVAILYCLWDAWRRVHREEVDA